MDILKYTSQSDGSTKTIEAAVKNTRRDTDAPPAKRVKSEEDAVEDRRKKAAAQKNRRHRIHNDPNYVKRKYNKAPKVDLTVNNFNETDCFAGLISFNNSPPEPSNADYSPWDKILPIPGTSSPTQPTQPVATQDSGGNNTQFNFPYSTNPPSAQEYALDPALFENTSSHASMNLEPEEYEQGPKLTKKCKKKLQAPLISPNSSPMKQTFTNRPGMPRTDDIPSATDSFAARGQNTKNPKDLTQMEGVSIPTRAETVNWADGHRTFVPWVSDKKKPSKNLLQKEATHVKNLAESAKPSTECPYITHLEYADFASETLLVKRIHEELAQGKPVILRGYPKSPIEMNTESIWEKAAIPPNRTFCAQDSVKRSEDWEHPHVNLTLADFCKGVYDESRIQSILDCPTVDGETPTFIKHLDQGHTAWYHVHGQFKDRHDIPMDVQKSKSWLLFHQPLFQTYTHHDAEGYCTWTWVRSGKKCWVFVRPYGFTSCENRKEYDEMVAQYLKASKNPNKPYYGEDSERFFVFASEGDIIIQPPTTLHEVYTATPSVTSGGHFYTYNTMHLTEVARAYDRNTEGRLTNQDHDSCHDTLSVMMCNLANLDEPVLHIKPMGAMCNMLLKPDMYIKLPRQIPGTYRTIPKKFKPTFDDQKKAINMAHILLRKRYLPTDLQHYPAVNFDTTKHDFIFADSDWMNPGFTISIANVF